MAAGYLAELWRTVSNIDGHRHLRLSTYGGRAFCHAGPLAWNALPVFFKNDALSLFTLDASLNISTSHFASTPSALDVILQSTRYTNYLLTYLPTYLLT